MIVIVVVVCETPLSHFGELPVLWNNGSPESRLTSRIENIDSTRGLTGNRDSYHPIAVDRTVRFYRERAV
ncbi:hypothetical protein [Paraburkholderia sp. BL10I2N1]|uniref:hypothetical protein n=1 Tax=Paraburkholderia sp. BL10I2N1 TaxID=1938796 RepID=UPI00105BB017|nr:hypothetical protein [Paraburkholderia sp. BL10I2N1]